MDDQNTGELGAGMDVLQWIEEHATLATLTAGAAPFLFRRVRGWAAGRLRAVQRWAARDRIEWQGRIDEHFENAAADRREFLGRIVKLEGMAMRADKALFNGGRTGIVQQLQLITAEANRSFDQTPVPMFKCDQHGQNIMTNAAYRRLMGYTREEALEGKRWQSVIYGEHAESYIETFRRCSDEGADFTHQVDFRNPLDGIHRGRWRIVAAAHHVGNGWIYVGTFAHAVDETAQEIAEELGFVVDE